MSEDGEAVNCDRAIPVQRLLPGDHAFAVHRSDAEQHDVLGAFIRQGLIEGEKVLVYLGPAHLDTRAPAPGPAAQRELLTRLDVSTPAVERALEEGRLQFSSMRELIGVEERFTAERQWHRLTEETDLAVREGRPAVRAYIDMAWIADLGADLSTVRERERNAGHLFAGRPYSEVCAYDARAFPADMLEAMAEAHPRNLLDRTGDFRAAHDENGVRLIGEADVSTGDAFRDALRTAFGRAPHLTVDLTTLHFLGAGCAADLLRMSAGAHTDGVRTSVRCTPFQARMLRRLGAGSLRSLNLTVAEGSGC